MAKKKSVQKKQTKQKSKAKNVSSSRQKVSRRKVSSQSKNTSRNPTPPKLLAMAKSRVKPVRMEAELAYSLKNLDNDALAGVLHEPLTPSDTLVIALHGFLASKKNHIIRQACIEFSRAGYNAFRVDLSGNGDSEGRFEDATPKKLLRDTLAIIEHFRPRYKRIFLFGHSLGAMIALLAATRAKVDGVISVAAPMHPEEYPKSLSEPQQEQLRSVGFTILLVQRSGVDVPYTVTERFITDLADMPPLDAAKDIHCPVLLIHGTADKRVPQRDTEELLDKLFAKDVLLVGGADHNFANPEHLDALLHGAISWLDAQAIPAKKKEKREKKQKNL